MPKRLSTKRIKRKPKKQIHSSLLSLFIGIAVVSLFSFGAFSYATNLKGQSAVLGASTAVHQSGFSFTNFFTSISSMFSRGDNQAHFSTLHNFSPTIEPTISTTLAPINLQVNSSSDGAGMQNPPAQSNGEQLPQIAISVCSGLPTGSNCWFTGQNGTVNGTCQTPPQQTVAACIPNQHPMRQHGKSHSMPVH